MSIDLSTQYLGLRLKSPLMPGASPMVDDIDVVKRLEDAGAAAIVMHSLFEEQITGEKLASIYHMEMFADSYAEALNYFPSHSDYALGPDQYLRQITRIKEKVQIPVIASLNGVTPRGWTNYAQLIEQAGADAIELNVYYLGGDVCETASAAEERLIKVVRGVIGSVKIPVAVKISPFFSSLANFAWQLDEAGAAGLVLFNRFYQPDIDVEQLEVKPALRLSDSTELLLRLRWTAMLSRKVKGSLAISGGVHTAVDAVKAVMAGADAVQIVSALLTHGPEYLSVIEQNLLEWMERNFYSSIRQMHGCMDLSTCPDPQAFERANYVRTLQSFDPSRRIVRFV